jgi:hypothetical protein
MKRRVTISSVHQNVRIDYEHYRPSIAWYTAYKVMLDLEETQKKARQAVK